VTTIAGEWRSRTAPPMAPTAIALCP